MRIEIDTPVPYSESRFTPPLPCVSDVPPPLEPSAICENSAEHPSEQCNVDARGYREEARLLEAAERGDINEMARLLNAGCSIDAADDAGFTPLMIAARADKRTAVVLLTDLGADLSHKNYDGDDALILASRAGNCEVVEILCEADADTRAQNKLGNDALIEAAARGYADIVDFLLRHHADPRAENKQHLSAIDYAARHGDARVVDMLCRSGARVDGREGLYQLTPLVWAARAGHVEVIRALCEHGANVNHKACGARTALSIATEAGQHGAMAILIEKGSDVDAAMPKRETPLIIATAKNDLVAMRLLIDGGARIWSGGGWRNNTPFQVAVMGHHLEALLYLIESGALIRGADDQRRALLREWAAAGTGFKSTPLIDVTDADGRTALMLGAWMAAPPEILTLLLGLGADVNAKDFNGLTALHHAIRGRGPNVGVEVLLRAGAEVNVQIEGESGTLVSYAGWHARIQAIRTLAQYGADPDEVDYWLCKMGYREEVRRKNEAQNTANPHNP